MAGERKYTNWCLSPWMSLQLTDWSVCVFRVVSSYYDERDFGAGKLVPPEVAAREARSRSRFG